MKRTLLLAAIALALSHPASTTAQLIKNGDFSVEVPDKACGGIFTGCTTNHSQFGDIDAGWLFKSAGNWTIDGLSGMAVKGIAHGERPLVQINSVGSETGSLLTLSLDWTPGPDANGTDPELNSLLLSYQLVGWRDVTSPADGDRAFSSLNGNSDAVRSFGGTIVDLNNGDIRVPRTSPPGDFNGNRETDTADYTVWRDNLGAATDDVINGVGDGVDGVDENDYNVWRDNYGLLGDPSSSQNNTLSTATFEGEVGVTNTFMTTLDLSSYGDDFDDVSDYQYIGVRFKIGDSLDGSQDVAAAGSMIANVSLVASTPSVATAVPEPSSCLLLVCCVFACTSRISRSMAR